MNSKRSSAHLAAVAMFIAWLAPAGARADANHGTVTLEYSAVTGCPEVGYFKNIVVDRLGSDAFAEVAPKRVVVRITLHGRTYEGNMEWLDANGNWAGDRTFPAQSTDCDDLVRAMAFTLALQLQLSAMAETPPSTGKTDTETKPSVGTTPAAPPPPQRVRPAIDPRKPPAQAGESPASVRSRPLLAVGAGALIGFGMSSSAVPFARIFGSIAWPHWSLEFATEASLPSTIRRADGAGFSREELLAAVAGCGTLQAWSACLIAKAGEIRITGKNIDVPNSAAGPVLETGLRARATQRIFQNVAVSAYVEALALPILWSVTLDDNVLWTSPRFAETTGFDVSLRFE
jgi:hypothetical protein